MDRDVIGEGEIHIWSAGLDGDPASVQRLDALLSTDERERASRFHFEKDRTRYARCHGILRILLGRYAGVAPSRLPLVKDQNGKPRLEGPSKSPSLSFNLSHSDDRAIFGICLGRPIGVDLERLRPVPDAAQMVENYFSPTEKSRFRAAPLSERDESFLSIWTKKEAYLKARGEGLSHPLDVDPDSKDGWIVESVSLEEPGFVAAVSTRGSPSKISILKWSDSELLQ